MNLSLIKITNDIARKAPELYFWGTIGLYLITALFGGLFIYPLQPSFASAAPWFILVALSALFISFFRFAVVFTDALYKKSGKSSMWAKIVAVSMWIISLYETYHVAQRNYEHPGEQVIIMLFFGTLLTGGFVLEMLFVSRMNMQLDEIGANSDTIDFTRLEKELQKAEKKQKAESN
jgi:hypothetical protein